MPTCLDIDECENDPCGQNEDCFNNQGSFRCYCSIGYVENDENFCEDKNECELGC